MWISGLTMRIRIPALGRLEAVSLAGSDPQGAPISSDLSPNPKSARDLPGRGVRLERRHGRTLGVVVGCPPVFGWRHTEALPECPVERPDRPVASLQRDREHGYAMGCRIAETRACLAQSMGM